jgi:hypothetical protein
MRRRDLAPNEDRWARVESFEGSALAFDGDVQPERHGWRQSWRMDRANAITHAVRRVESGSPSWQRSQRFMRRGTFAIAVGLGVAVPVIALGVVLSRPEVRSLLTDFVAPLPTAARPAVSTSNVEALPPQLAITGAESSELRQLGSGDAGTPTDRGARTSLFPRDLPAAREAYERPRGLKRPDLASRDDPAVDRAIQYLATDERGHGALLAAIQRSGRYRDEVDRILRAWKLPSELSAVAFVESAFSPTATSLDGSAGLWSLAPEVARAYGLAMLPKYDERRSLALSTEAAAHYLADLHERLGSWELALFAFGQGYARALNLLQKQSSLEYWDIASELPADGTGYVAQVLAVATMLGNPDRFGLDLAKPDEPQVTSDLEVPADATFSILARAAGTSVARLHELNPEYLGDAVPSTGFVMTMHLPSAGLARAKELLMPLMYSNAGGGGSASFDWGRRSASSLRDGGWGAGPTDGSDASLGGPVDVARGGARRVYYRAQEGDTLESVSRRFGVPRETIASDNALDPSAGLKPGELLLLRPSAGAAPQDHR